MDDIVVNDGGENTNDFTFSGEVDVSFEMLGDGVFVKASVSIDDEPPLISSQCFHVMFLRIGDKRSDHITPASSTVFPNAR